MKKLDNFNEVEAFWFRVAAGLLIIVILVGLMFFE